MASGGIYVVTSLGSVPTMFSTVVDHHKHHLLVKAMLPKHLMSTNVLR